MARVTGPLHSDGASGKLAGALVYSHWKGNRQYVRTLVTPLNPHAAKQVGVRAMMGYVAHLWASIKAASAASWKTLADATSISEFNAFVARALDDWQEFLFPVHAPTDDRSSTPLTVTTQTCTGGVGCATISVTPSGSTAIAGIAIFRGLTGFVPGWDKCIAILPANGASAVEWVDSPLAAGTYYYRSVVFNVDGAKGAVHAESSGTVVTAP